MTLSSSSSDALRVGRRVDLARRHEVEQPALLVEGAEDRSLAGQLGHPEVRLARRALDVPAFLGVDGPRVHAHAAVAEVEHAFALPDDLSEPDRMAALEDVSWFSSATVNRPPWKTSSHASRPAAEPSYER